jgi:hypothetical protein
MHFWGGGRGHFLEWGESTWHVCRLPLFGLLYQLRMINDKCGAVGGMRIGKGNRCTLKTRLNTSLSITNPTLSELGSNSVRCSWKPAINRMSYGMARG